MDTSFNEGASHSMGHGYRERRSARIKIVNDQQTFKDDKDVIQVMSDKESSDDNDQQPALLTSMLQQEEKSDDADSNDESQRVMEDRYGEIEPAEIEREPTPSPVELRSPVQEPELEQTVVRTER